jgi:hypothetical protein
MSAGECSGDTFAAFSQARSARRGRDRDAWARWNTIRATARGWMFLVASTPACAPTRNHGLALTLSHARGLAAATQRSRGGHCSTAAASTSRAGLWGAAMPLPDGRPAPEKPLTGRAA